MNKQEINWENSGLLRGLDENHKKTITKLLNVTSELNQTHYYHNERIEQYLFPCIRRIYQKLFIEKNISSNLSIEDIDIKYIMTSLDNLYPTILLLQQNFTKLDVESELTEMFCKNYIKK